MQQIKVYISAKLEHAAKLAALQVDGFHINARWIEMADLGRKRMKPVTHWQQENFDDIGAAHFFILYAEPSDQLKGSLFEIGYAVGIGKRCWVAGNGVKGAPGDAWAGLVDVTPEGAANSIQVPHKDVLPWGHYRQAIRMAPTLEMAFSQIRQIVRPDRIKNVDGSMAETQEF